MCNISAGPTVTDRGQEVLQVPQQPRGCPHKADTAAACRGPHGRAAGCASEPTAPGGPTLEQPVPEGLHPMVQACAGEALGELQPPGIVVQRLKDHAPWERPPLEQGKVARRKEQQRSSTAEKQHYDCKPYSASPCAT